METKGNDLQIIPITSGSQYFDKQGRVLTLQKAESFAYTIGKLKDELDATDKKLKAEQAQQKGKPPVKGKSATEQKKQDLLAQYADLLWLWQIAAGPDRLDLSNHNESFGKGMPQSTRQVSFPKFLEGGGYIWLEGFRGTATGSPSNGIFVCAKGNPDIIGVEWTNLNGDNIDGKQVKFGDTVLLRVYTEALFGSQVIVKLQDKDLASWVDSPDLLPAYEREGGTPKNKKEGENTPSKEFQVLTRAVSYGPFKSAMLSPEQGERLRKTLGSLEGHTEKYVQKAEIKVYIDEFWRYDGGTSLKIFPTVNVRSLNAPKAFEEKYITVEYSAQEAPVQSQLSPTGNKPILAGEIETNISAFRHCYYTAVKVTTPLKNEEGKEEEKPIYLFKEKSDEPIYQQIRDFEVVVGETTGLKKITIELEQLHNNESECVSQTKHKGGHTLTIDSYPEQKALPAPKQEVKEEKEEEKVQWKVKTKTDAALGSIETKRSIDSSVALKVYTPKDSDEKLTFDARFIYNKTPIGVGPLTLPYAFRYFWMGANAAGTPYIINANTCRYQNRVKVIPYPDIEWKLALEYNKFEPGAGEDASAKTSRVLMNNFKQSRPQHQQEHKFVDVGGRKLGVSLSAKWNGSDEVSFSDEFIKNLQEKFKTVIELVNMLENIFSPKSTDNDPDAQRTLDDFKRSQGNEIAKREREERDMRKQREYLRDAKRDYSASESGTKDRRDARKKMEQLDRRGDSHFEGMKREAVGLDIIWPSLEGSFGWKLVNTNTNQAEQYRNKVGLYLTGTIECAPLIGASIYFDFLALVQRAHPIAYAVIAIADLTLALLGDGSKIVCELRITGTINGKLEGFVNTLTGENTFNKKDRKANSTDIATVSGELKISLKVQIKIATKKNLVFVAVEGSLSASAEATATWKARAEFDTDKQGFFANIYGNFDGLVLKGGAKASVKVKGRKGGSMGTEGGVDVEKKVMPKQPEALLKKLVLASA
ncbi:hypothetical protein [Taibaiella koreensis]|uniref:hypothetical protein n=1 Tax=Taibaiella koreensis TaxID=1268548 RepID=UPI000E59ACC9|nr:hypothetical protein [Taibaiella koreensis]